MPPSPKQEWELLNKVLPAGQHVLLYGPPGTGKTTVARTVAKRTNKSVFSITMTEETPAAELRGHYIPSGDEWQWRHGPAISAWHEGAMLLINEINLASGDALTFLYAICDDPEWTELTLPTNEVVRPAAGFQVIATMNGLPDELPEPLQDRFTITIPVHHVNPEAIKVLSGDLQKAATTTAKYTDERRISVRRWKTYDSLREVVGPEMAAQAIFGADWKNLLTSLELSTL